MDNRFEVVIGLECHAQLRTTAKLFCGCPVDAELPPNTAVCEVCLGHPGSLPVLNPDAVRLALRSAVALSCTVHPRSRFSRKHYFYPDLPKGFQITQHEHPLATGGVLHTAGATYTLTRIHIEEDAGRLIHAADASLVDWNRAGVPLIEIVGAPDIPTPEAAEAWLRMLHRVLVDGGICTGDLERGHLRCDANVSLHRAGGPTGVRVEVKNLNSFRAVAAALRFEITRQAACLRAGTPVAAETRRWTGTKTASARPKENTADYQPLEEYDLPSIDIQAGDVQASASALPGVPLDLHLLGLDHQRETALMTRDGLGPADARTILADPDAERFYTEAIAAGGEPRATCFLVQAEILRRLHAGGTGRLEPGHLAGIQQLLAAGVINRDGARTAFDILAEHGGEPAAVVARHDLGQVGDESRLRSLLDGILREHPKELARYQAGSAGLFGFFVGRLMAVTGRRADPALVHRLVRTALGESGSAGGRAT